MTDTNAQQQRIEALRERLKEKVQQHKERQPLEPAPRYDDAYWEAVRNMEPPLEPEASPSRSDPMIEMCQCRHREYVHINGTGHCTLAQCDCGRFEAQAAPEASPSHSILLTSSEAAFLFGLVNDRVLGADKEGISREHSSSIFRQQLWEKLLNAKTAAQAAPSPARHVHDIHLLWRTGRGSFIACGGCDKEWENPQQVYEQGLRDATA